jgi:hypothetical protein
MSLTQELAAAQVGFIFRKANDRGRWRVPHRFGI